jgi:unsaturated rhamnogalacturonyl hydrolase
MHSPSYYPARIVNAPSRSLPEGKRLPQGWTAVPIYETGDGLHLVWSADDGLIERPIQSSCRMRITVALDYREAQFVEVTLLQSGKPLGRFDIRYGYVFQPFEFTLTAEQAEAALREGISLRLDGGEQQLWIFDELTGDPERQLFVPHLLIGEGVNQENNYVDRFVSLSSLQPFGWLEGCVLDGLYALCSTLGTERVDPVLNAHLDQFLDAEGRLQYEDLHGQKADGKFTTIEATLPLAVIVKHRPELPVVKQAVAFWERQGATGDGAVIDEGTITAEGAYTVAYPLAAVASQLKREDLAGQAVRQLLLRRDWLVRDSHVYLRYHQDTRTHTFRSWARAYAWYMLGMTRTWIELKEAGYAGLPGVNEIEQELIRVADAALSWRQPDGLWSVFLDESVTGIDTSGSAGIATALALGAKHGLLSQTYMTVAKESLSALEPYLTPDGILSGVAQHNAGGMELQRGGYRVLSQMGLGLMVQLYAATRTTY